MSYLPKEIRHKRGLAWGAKVLFAELADNPDATTTELAQTLDVTGQAVRNWLGALVDGGFIRVEGAGKGRKITLALAPEIQTEFGEGVLEVADAELINHVEATRNDPPALIVLPWQTVAFQSAWDAWKAYKASQHRFRYKTAETEQRALMRLQKISDNNEGLAIAAIEDSMAQAYQGIHLSSGIRREHAKPKHDDLANALRDRGHI